MANISINDIKTIVANQLGVGNVQESDRIVEDLGAESADIANIIAAVEDKYNVTVPEDVIQDIQTVRDVFVQVQSLG